MTTSATLLRGLERRGVHLSATDGVLRYREARPGALSLRLRALVERHRGALVLSLLPRTTPTCTSCRRHHFATPRRCFWCERGLRSVAGVQTDQRLTTPTLERPAAV